MKQIQERIQSLPKKAPAKKTKPVARRRPAVQPVRKKPAVKKPVARKKAPEINITADVPESVRKRIEQMVASGRMKAPMTPSRTTPKKKAAPTLTIINGVPTQLGPLGERGTRMPDMPKKTAAKKFEYKPPKRDYSGFEGTPGSGRVSSGTTVFDRYDPETDTYYGTIGGFAGPIPTSVKGSEVGETFKKNWAAANKGYTPPKQQTQSQTPAPQTPAPQPPAPPPTQQQTGGGSFESDYIDWLESKPKPPSMRPQTTGRKGVLYKKKKEQYDKDIAAWEARKPSRLTYTAPTPAPAPAPAPTSAPAPTPPASDPPDKFEGRYRPPTSPVGTPDSLIPRNIVGQSFNPYLAAFAGGQQNPYQGSFMGPQQQQPSSTFGGYGQRAPMFAMAPYAGLAQSQPMPIDFFPSYVPRPDPIYETVPFPMPEPQPDAEPVMVAPRQGPLT
jgi:hypothetical protein